ncbi:hypothetical protein HELRODRAFT_165194 [Helobdella robusta]|uniref:Anillin homology domain-containing protein n=1 Tax=Helobdella robusta TaxID=6412 RepID=T1EWE9_HELRO|nr:hypothetical protein HELRODRAFT_165194 [Helobdella robusta]ESN93038.1 hypothetical protein HELRODRAFT_165194 [Helobdella robusta]
MVPSVKSRVKSFIQDPKEVKPILKEVNDNECNLLNVPVSERKALWQGMINKEGNNCEKLDILKDKDHIVRGSNQSSVRTRMSMFESSNFAKPKLFDSKELASQKYDASDLRSLGAGSASDVKNDFVADTMSANDKATKNCRDPFEISDEYDFGYDRSEKRTSIYKLINQPAPKKVQLTLNVSHTVNISKNIETVSDKRTCCSDDRVNEEILKKVDNFIVDRNSGSKESVDPLLKRQKYANDNINNNNDDDDWEEEDEDDDKGNKRVSNMRKLRKLVNQCKQSLNNAATVSGDGNKNDSEDDGDNDDVIAGNVINKCLKYFDDSDGRKPLNDNDQLRIESNKDNGDGDDIGDDGNKVPAVLSFLNHQKNLKSLPQQPQQQPQQLRVAALNAEKTANFMAIACYEENNNDNNKMVNNNCNSKMNNNNNNINNNNNKDCNGIESSNVNNINNDIGSPVNNKKDNNNNSNNDNNNNNNNNGDENVYESIVSMGEEDYDDRSSGQHSNDCGNNNNNKFDDDNNNNNMSVGGIQLRDKECANKILVEKRDSKYAMSRSADLLSQQDFMVQRPYSCSAALNGRVQTTSSTTSDLGSDDNDCDVGGGHDNDANKRATCLGFFGESKKVGKVECNPAAKGIKQGEDGGDGSGRAHIHRSLLLNLSSDESLDDDGDNRLSIKHYHLLIILFVIVNIIVIPTLNFEALLEKIQIEESILQQSTNALKQCNVVSSSNSSSAIANTCEHVVECHRLILISRKKIEVYEKELRMRRSDSLPCGQVTNCSGRITINNLSLPLHRDIMITENPDRHFFIVHLRSGTQFFFSQVLSPARSATELLIPGPISFDDLQADFRIIVEIYAMTLSGDSAHTSSSTSSSAAKKRTFLTPKKKFLPSKSPIKVSKAFDFQRLNTSFNILGLMEVSVDDLECCSREGIKFDQDSIGCIDLSTCVYEQVGPIPRDICARPHTFQLVSVKNRSTNDKETLVSKLHGGVVTTKYVASEDQF